MSRVRNLILLLLVLVCGASFWLARRQPTAPIPQVSVGETPAERPVATSHVAVLNGTEVAGLARRISRLLPSHGCVVTRVDNAPDTGFETSLLVNRRLPPEQAQQLAQRLGILRVLTEWDGRCDEDAVLVLGADHAQLLARLGG